MRSGWKFLAMLILMVTVAACERGTTTPEAASLTGEWLGESLDATVQMNLDQATGGQISGTGRLMDDAGDDAVSVSGQNRAGAVSLRFTFTEEDFEDFFFNGEVSGEDTFFGALDGSGFDNFNVIFRRQ